MKVVLQKQQIEFRVDVPAGGHICHDRDALLQGLGLLVGAIIRRQSFKHIGNRMMRAGTDSCEASIPRG